MEENYFTVEDLNKLITKFIRANDKKRPTKLILGSKEYEDIQNWYYEFFPGPDRSEPMNTVHERFKRDIENLHTKPFGLELIRVDKDSYLEVQ